MQGKEKKSGCDTDRRHKTRTNNCQMEKTAGFLGHVLRRNGLENSCLVGMINEKRARGRQRHKYMDGIKEAANIQTTVEVLRAIQDRNVWRSIVTNVNIDTALR